MPLYETLNSLFDSDDFDIRKLDISITYAKYSDFTTDNLLDYINSISFYSTMHVSLTGQVSLSVKDNLLNINSFNIKSLYRNMFYNYFKEYVPDFLSKSFSEKDKILNELSDDFFEFIKDENKNYIEDEKYNNKIYCESCSNYFSENCSKLDKLFIYFKINDPTYISNGISFLVALPLHINVIYDRKCIAKEYVIFHLD